MFCSLLARCRIPGACHATRHPNVQKCSAPLNFSTFDFEMCFAPQRPALFLHRKFKKCSEPFSFSPLLTSKCASHHNGVHFFDIATSKSGPRMVCFLYILTSKCASRHNGMHFFDISISKSGPKLVCVLYMLLGNVLRATTAYIFSTYQLPKVV